MERNHFVVFRCPLDISGDDIASLRILFANTYPCFVLARPLSGEPRSPSVLFRSYLGNGRSASLHLNRSGLFC